MKFKYVYKNVNPALKEVGDCVIRAISLGNEKDWKTTMLELTDVAIEISSVCNCKDCYEEYLKCEGWTKHKMPKRPYYNSYKRYTIEEFINSDEYNGETLLIKVANHLTCVKDGVLYDIWNCSFKSMGNYWTKEL